MPSPLDDLFEGPLPSSFRDLVGRFTTDGVTSTPFAGGTQHSGTLKSLQTDPIRLGFGELELPGITAGTPFRLAIFDAPAGHWHLDIVLDGISLKLNDLHGADFIKEAGTTPRRLVRRATDTAVVISGNATIRFAKASDDAPVVLLFVENRSAADPLANTGTVVDLRCNPPHFFFGSSQFGMTLTELLFDFSDSFSPPYIIQQGQTPQWVGFAIAEATFYAPPNAIGHGGFSGGVRNLLLGSPKGVQGEFEVQWGRAPLDPSTFVFTQAGHAATAATGSDSSRLVAITAGQDEPVAISVSFVASQPPEGGAVTDWQATWRWPDGTETTGDLAAGTIAHGQILRVVPEEHIAGRPVLRHPEISFRFVAAGDVPEIDVFTAGASVVNAAHVAGPAAAIAGLAFHARSTAAAAGTFHWKLGPNGTEQTGASINLAAGDIAGDQSLVLRETDASGHDRVTRLRVQAIEGVSLLIGGEDGVVDATTPAAPITPAAVEATFDLTDFHASARLRPVLDVAMINAVLPERVDVPAGALALVTISSGGAPPPPTPSAADRHVDILFAFNSGSALSWGSHPPSPGAAAGGDADFQRQLLSWAANFPGATFLVVGRCDDLGGDALNAALARTRRDTALRLLTTALAGSALVPVALAQITAWGEQDGQPGSIASSPLDSEEAAAQRLILAADDVSGAPLTNRSGWPTTHDTAHAAETVRMGFRRVDVYAVGGTPTAAAAHQPVAAGRAPDLRRILMPGENADPVPAESSTPAIDYRVKLLAGWDKPTGDGWHDLIPSKAEFEFAWSPDDHPLPSLGGQPVTLEVLTVYGSWRHDDATGFTRAQIGIRSDGDPDGLVKIDQANLVAALALGPVLLSGVNSTTDTFEAAGRVAALAAGTAFAQVDLGGGPLVGTGSKAVIKSIEATAELKDIDAVGDDYKISLVSDYTTTLHVNTGRLGLRTEADHPVKFRYNHVGIVFDQSKTNFWDKIAVNYPTDALTIEDPGKWQIEGVLGELLRAVETALGTGSIWTETRFAFALTIGVVEISEAVIRVTFDGSSPIPDFSLRGLVAKVDIPATVKGEGRLRIEDPGGVIKAGLDLEVIPLQLKASAAFAMASITTPEPFTFVNLYAKVQFPVGIPLGPSGAALHGFIGQTVINGTRDVIASTDIVAREIGWWRKNPEDKYRPLKDQHALGLGVVVGTLPDASFSLSATGMIVVAFPDPEVILAVEINILSVPDRTAKDKKDGQSASITGLIVIDDTAVSLAAQARYTIPEVLQVTVPFAAYFPYSGHGIYVRIGSDGQMGRSGEPVTLTLLPSTINLQAFAYLMIEQDGLPSLGGRPDFSFQGFSVGFGAGASLEWRAGPIKLSASILLLAGFGTDPLLIKAGIFVNGELDLVVISIAARGQIILTYQQGTIWMDGEFCGEVDCFFFSIEGCVSFRIGNEPTIAVPPPAPPVASIMLTDRGGRVMGEARPNDGGALAAEPIFRLTEVNGKQHNTGVATKDNHTVWADTTPVINFSHFIIDAIPDNRQFDPLEQPSGARWFGSNRLKYAYRLDEVRLVRDDNGVTVAGSKPLQSVWCTSPARQPGSGGSVQPSGLEVTSLKLLDWQPWGWALPMADGGASANGDPAETIGNLCVPIAQPARACLFGRDARGAGPNRIRVLHETPPPGPYPSYFTLTGRPALRVGASIIEGAALVSLVAGAGGLPVAGAVVTLSQPVAGPMGPLTQGYRLPGAQLATAGQVRQTALPWLADLDTSIHRGRLLLLVCDGRSRRGDKTPANCYRFDGLSIGKAFTSLDVPGYSLIAVDAKRPFTVTDEVDLAHGSPTLGADRQPDIRIAFPGLIIRPRTPVRTLDLHFFRDEAVATKIEWIDTAGVKGSVMEPGIAKGAVTVRVAASADIKEVRITLRAKTLHLVEICAVGADQSGSCFGFANANPDAVAKGRFSHGGVTFTAIDPGVRLGLLDIVDAAATPPKKGRDGTMDLRFPDKGVELRLDTAATHVSIGVWSGGGPVRAIAFDSAGNAVAKAEDPARDPVELHLDARDIVRVIVSGGSNEAVIWRVCRGTTVGETCLGFGKKARRGLKKLALGAMTITPAKNGKTLTLADVVNDIDPLVTMADGTVELLVPAGGLVFVPDTSIGGMTLHVALLGGAKAEAIAFDADGKKIAADGGGGGNGDALVRLALIADGIARVELQAGGKTFVTRVCTAPPGTDAGGRPSAAAVSVAAATAGLPVVSTLHDNALRPWTATPIGSIASPDGGVCRIVAYDQPASVPDAGSFQIATPSGSIVTLLSLCGVDSRADIARADDLAAQGALAAAVGTAATADIAEAAREILLDPGVAYRIEVSWSWQHWKSNKDGTNAPTPADEAVAWTTGAPQSFRFRIAAEELAITETQDGLNEYRFDPRDIARYLSRTEPADGRDVVFTDDPLWVHFSAGHVANLVDRYGRELRLDVRRTDPPPQPNEAAMQIATIPDLLELFHVKGPLSVQPLAEQRINAAVVAAPCLPDGQVAGGASLGARFALKPNAMYDFNLLAVKKGAAPALADPVVVNATRFKTSRYANPTEMLAALGFGVAATTPFAPDEILLGDAMTLPAGPLVVSDLDLGAALAAIGADTLPLPGEHGRTIALWKRTGGVYGLLGFLIDSPEPMRRVAAVLQGQEAVDAVRCEPDRLTIGGTTFMPVRASLNWTRVLFVAAASVVPAGADPQLQFRLKVAPSGSITGTRIVRSRPLMLETEGF